MAGSIATSGQSVAEASPPPSRSTRLALPMRMVRSRENHHIALVDPLTFRALPFSRANRPPWTRCFVHGISHRRPKQRASRMLSVRRLPPHPLKNVPTKEPILCEAGSGADRPQTRGPDPRALHPLPHPTRPPPKRWTGGRTVPATLPSTTSVLTAATFVYTLEAGITAAAGTRLALQLLLTESFAYRPLLAAPTL